MQSMSLSAHTPCVQPLANHARALLLAAAMACSVAVPPAHARDGVDVGGNSAFASLVPAETVERSAGKQYAAMLQEAANKRALAPKNDPQLQRLRVCPPSAPIDYDEFAVIWLRLQAM